MKKILFAVLMLVATFAYAQPYDFGLPALGDTASIKVTKAALQFRVAELYVHTWTRHARHNERLNDYNDGFGVILTNGITAGTYRNSIWRNSVYVGYKIDFNDWIGVVPGLLNGYCRNGSSFVPFGVIVATLPLNHVWWVKHTAFKHVRVHLTIAPAPQQSVINASFGWHF